MQKINLSYELPDAEVNELESTFLDSRHFDFVVTGPAQVFKPTGELLLELNTNVLPLALCEQTYPDLREASADAANRIVASGKAAPNSGAKSDVLGFLDRGARYGNAYCRMTAWALNSPETYKGVLTLARAVDAVFRDRLPTRYDAQMEMIRKTSPEFAMTGTAFTTVTVNRNFRTAVHKDSGDLPQGFGVLTCLNAGQFSGGELIFPKFRVAVRLGTQDVLLCDVHEAHGNAPLVGVPGKYERISCVFYYRQNMIHCGSAPEEIAFAKSRTPGDALYSAHSSPHPALPPTSVGNHQMSSIERQDLNAQQAAFDDRNEQGTQRFSAGELAGVQLRVAAPEDREKLEAFCKGPTCPKIGKEFPFIWRRNGNWGTERNRPTIAVMDHQIIGFHATSYTKGGYCNLYYVVVDTEVKRMGLGKTLIENSLKRGHALGMTRWTNKSHKGSDGENFFSNHLGILPIAEKGDEVIYDWSIKGVNTIEDLRTILGDKLRTTATDLYSLHEIPERKLNAYAKANVESGLIMLLEVPNLPAYVPKSTPSSGNVSADVGLDKPEERKAAVANSLDPSIENDVLGSGVSPRKSKRNVLNGTGTVNAPSEPALSYEGMTQQKTILFMIAPGASGKTTLRRQFTSQDAGAERFHFSKQCYFSSRYTCCGENFRKKEELEIHLAGGEPSSHKPEKGCYDAYKVGYTFFSNGTAICGLTGKNGHPGTGADANGNLDANMVAIDHALMHRDFVIFDGVITSERLFFHLQNHPYPNLKLVFVHLNFSEEIVRARLAKRRADNKKSGKGAAKEPDAWLTTISGAKRRWIQAKSIVTRPNVQWIEISDPTLTPEQLKNQIEEETRNHDYNIPTVSFACLRTGNPFASFTK